jgi:hypothetical protein
VQIVEGIVQGLQFGLTAIARSRIDVADVQAALETARVRRRGRFLFHTRRERLAGHQIGAVFDPKSPIIRVLKSIGWTNLNAELAGDAAAIVHFYRFFSTMVQIRHGLNGVRGAHVGAGFAPFVA